MATAGWRGARPLSEVLRAEPQRFDALQAVRLLETAGGGAGAAAVRFRGALGSAFPASEIDRLDPPAEPGAPVELTVSFMALAGGFGPLPRPLAELVSARAQRKDTAARDFLDIFNHRLVALLIQLRRLPRPAAEPVAPPRRRGSPGGCSRSWASPRPVCGARSHRPPPNASIGSTAACPSSRASSRGGP